MNLSALLSRYLEKLGVADFTQLDAEERETYDQWREVLEKEATLEDVTKFIEHELSNLNKELQEAVRDGDDRKAILTAARLQNYNDLKHVITAPERNREQLAGYINNLLKHE